MTSHTSTSSEDREIFAELLRAVCDQAFIPEEMFDRYGIVHDADRNSVGIRQVAIGRTTIQDATDRISVEDLLQDVSLRCNRHVNVY